MSGRSPIAAALLCVLCFLCAILGAEEGPGREAGALSGLPPASLSLPSRIYPGDRLQISIALEGEGPSEPPLLEGDLELLSFEPDEGEGLLRLELRAWASGSFIIPAFRAGGRSLGPLGLRVESALDAHGRELRPQRKALLLPGTGAALALLLSALAALSLMSWGFASFLLPRIKRFLRARARRRPLTRLRRSCALLERRAEAEDCRNFYALLSRAFRSWAAERAHPAFAALSAAEVAALARAGEGEAGPLAALAPAAAALARSDLARFAGQAPGVQRRRSDIAELLALAEAWEGSDDQL